VVTLVDDALADGARIALLCGTNSTPADNVGTAAAFAFGVQRARHIKLVNTWGSDDDSANSGDWDSSSFEDGLSDLNRASAEAKAKVTIAGTASRERRACTN
jgi:hypothetical protein